MVDQNIFKKIVVGKGKSYWLKCVTFETCWVIVVLVSYAGVAILGGWLHGLLGNEKHFHCVVSYVLMWNCPCFPLFTLRILIKLNLLFSFWDATHIVFHIVPWKICLSFEEIFYLAYYWLSNGLEFIFSFAFIVVVCLSFQCNTIINFWHFRKHILGKLQN
jgi:hypothetical protein